MVKLTVSLISLSSVHCLFAFPTILTIVANKCEVHIKCVQLLKTSCNQFNKCRIFLEYMIAGHQACIHKNWSSMTQVAFLATKINKEQQPHQKIF